ncbi:hypothetical protein SASPL_124211 [Salvia splendens]|uniref:F-box domain-containing protein n=1 Tax=Salvia splendens TaxID=180675 RepID=A0A8X8ZTY0_SALSN|nr:hypothetical protein SASPL_124211 [Salvia splendens]
MQKAEGERKYGGWFISVPPWIELPEDVTFNIMQRLGAEDLLCSTWWKVCKDPCLWRVVEFSNPYQENSTDKYTAMYRSAVDRSQGQLVELNIHYSGDDTLMEYIAHRGKIGMIYHHISNAFILSNTYESDTDGKPTIRLVRSIVLAAILGLDVSTLVYLWLCYSYFGGLVLSLVYHLLLVAVARCP